jgi:CheY-like chemotaxis protein
MDVNTISAHPLVLIVDDEPLLRLMNADMLIDAGFDVIEASNADEALALLDQNRDVRVVFTDVEMPGQIDGFALADRIGRAYPMIGVVVTSGRRLPSPSFNAAAQQFLPKPYSLDHVVRLIDTFVERQR